MDTFLQDLRYGLRMLWKAPTFTAVAVLTLAIGIGANTAIFSVVNAVLLRPLPYPEPERLTRIYSEFPTMDLRKFWISPPEFLDIQTEARSWDGVGAWSIGGANIGTKGEPLRVTGAIITRSLIDTLGTPPAMGRNFTVEEDRSGGPKAALISDGLWQRAFGRQPDIIGQPIQIDSQPYTVIGIMPPGYIFPVGTHDPADVWVSFQFDPANPGSRGSHFLSVIGRLKRGTTMAQAQSEFEMLMSGWKHESRSKHLLTPEKHPILMLPLQEDVVGDVRPAVLMLLGAVAFVLLIACANVANLLLARTEVRQREIAVRLALGSSRWRMLTQFLAEGLVLVLLGSSAGLLFAIWGLDLILSLSPDSIPRTHEIGLDLNVLAFTFGVSIVAVLLFGLAPMIHFGEGHLADQLRDAGQRTIGGVRGHFFRKGLVVAEIALAVILVVGSGLMIRGFWKLRTVNVGFEPRGVVTFDLELPSTKYPGEERLRFFNTLKERLATLPSVTLVAYMDGLPPNRPILANDTDIEDYTAPPEGPFENVDYWNVVSQDYFQTLGIRLIEGRTFERADQAQTAQRVAVVNQSLARRFWKGSPLGRRLSPSFSDKPEWHTIVGIVEDTKNAGVDQPAGPELYLLSDQYAGFGLDTHMNVLLRTSGDPLTLAGAIRSTLQEQDPSIPIIRLRTMSDVIDASLVRPRFLSVLLAAFSLIALTLAAVGIYGVMAYSVTQRTQEIGIRMALGAQQSDVLSLVLGQGMKLTLVGLGLGLAGAFALTRLTASLLFEITPTDPTTYGGVAALLSGIALLACYVPARRASKVDPLVALRYE